MSHFRSIFRQISTNNSYQVSDYGPDNDAFSTFQPDDVAGLKVWLDANSSGHITQSGGEVATWSNRIQSVGGSVSGASDLHVTLQSNYINTSRSAILYSTGTFEQGYMQSTFNFRDFLTDAGSNKPDSFSWWFAVQANPYSAGSGYAYSNANICTSEHDAYMLVGGRADGETEDYFRFDETDIDWENWVRSTDTITSGTNYIINVIFERLGATGYYLTMAVDGGSDNILDKSTSTSPFSLSAAGSQKLRLGGSVWPKNARPVNRAYYEVLLYDGKLSDANRTLVTNYLKDKWGIG